LEQDWSPEQIAGRLGAAGILEISRESIYLRLHRERRTALSLWGHLRQGRRQRRRRRGGSPRPRLRGRSIHERPANVEARRAIGHWELDTVVGQGGGDGILTAVERATGFVAIGKLRRPTAVAFARRAIQLLRRQPHPIRTLTMDNGVEMSEYRRIEVASMTFVTQLDCINIANRLNQRPRKRLQWFTPEECYGG